jgi:1,4-dihydroxy-2-naphthoyl-CoA synthase
MTRAYRTIRIEHEDALSWIVLDRPQAATPCRLSCSTSLPTPCTGFVTKAVRSIAIRGEGRGFCSGLDLGAYGGGDVGPADPMADRARLEANVARWLLMWDHPKPVIAAVHGYCIATAAQMCVFTDITIVADDVRIGEPTIPIGGRVHRADLGVPWSGQAGEGVRVRARQLDRRADGGRVGLGQSLRTGGPADRLGPLARQAHRADAP